MMWIRRVQKFLAMEFRLDAFREYRTGKCVGTSLMHDSRFMSTEGVERELAKIEIQEGEEVWWVSCLVCLKDDGPCMSDLDLLDKLLLNVPHMRLTATMELRVDAGDVVFVPVMDPMHPGVVYTWEKFTFRKK